jgi:hypothetical protein
MLPVAYQTPAAIVLIAGGLLAWAAGYRLFKLVLGVYGCLLGAAIASTIVGSANPWWMVAAAIAGGVAGAVVLVAAYFVGVALVGAGVAALAVHLGWAAFGGEPHPLVVVAVALVGAFGALALQRYVVIVGTACAGAWTAIVGYLALRSGASLRSGDVWLVHPPSLGTNRGAVVAAWLGLALVGLVIQFRFTARGGSTRRPRRTKH